MSVHCYGHEILTLANKESNSAASKFLRRAISIAYVYIPYAYDWNISTSTKRIQATHSAKHTVRKPTRQMKDIGRRNTNLERESTTNYSFIYTVN